MRPASLARPLAFLATLSAAPLAATHAQVPTTSTTQPAAPVTPSFAPIAPLRVSVGDSLRVPVIVNDLPVGTLLELRMERQPASATLVNGVLRWRPLRADAGAAYNIGLHALVNGHEVAQASFALSVDNAHRPPVLRQPADRVIAPGDSLALPLEVSDPDGDPVSLAATNVTDPALPPRIDQQTHLLTWHPPRGPANRTYLWRVTANDGDGGVASTEFHVAVRSQNVAPSCAPMRTYKRDEGESVDIALDAEDANGDTLTYQPLATLPNGTQKGATYHWDIPFNFVLPTRQDSTLRFEWRATDPSQATTNAPCFALVTVFRSIAEEPFREKQAQHRQLIADVRTQVAALATKEQAARDSLASVTNRKRTIKRASLLSALVGGILQIAKSEDTRRVAAGVSATATVALAGWETTIDDGGPISARAESLAQQKATLQRALSRFIRKYGETVSREALLGPTYAADQLELYDLLTGAQ